MLCMGGYATVRVVYLFIHNTSVNISLNKFGLYIGVLNIEYYYFTPVFYNSTLPHS